ncbi:hypothetical protein BC939DRAFT_503804 [Gamsiella multidivaricata]|uniref:uncharacterized protein n=1 Tax=Gamsiella multidivaricata TaxID=101098 RepID=UPI00221F7FB5|nr:uncharacterized protein BC939DRAFT_503804 [Gamsiella multidivaricata]KAG0370635.1 hypothetical protein BGZ54_005145 [Gamsiella multidivaricata]KAI7822589.1 hypothetical protein BC939DRAFT_503804 [Gamsiella multidivaricata]
MNLNANVNMTTSHPAVDYNTSERLLRSADSLDCALSSQDKKNSALSRQGFLNCSNVDPVFGSTDLPISLFDDWLSGDLHQVSLQDQDQGQGQDHASFSSSSSPPSTSSDSDSNSHSPVFSAKSVDSPALSFGSIASDKDLVQSPACEQPIPFFPEFQSNPIAPPTKNDRSNHNNQSHRSGVQKYHNHSSRNTTDSANSVKSGPMMPLTPEVVQRAAAALNIPWSKSLEEAVLAQSLLSNISMPMSSMSLHEPAEHMAPLTSQLSGPPYATSTAAAAVVANMMLNHVASINVAHDSAMDITPPCTPAIPISPGSPISPSLTFHDERESSVAPPLSSLTSGLTVLSSSQTHMHVSGSTKSMQAAAYKSTYRSASLVKRNREVEEPPSVLEGKDISEMDETALKRAKNTDAARRSRHKKLVRMESLEQRVAELEIENSMFESKLNEVELERSLLADKDQMQQIRIHELELMLAHLREKFY